MPASASPSSPRKSESPAKSKKAPKKEVPATGGSDIRNFFSQGAGGSSSQKANGTKSGSGKQPITIDDSDDDEIPIKKPISSRPSTSKHFASSTKKAPVVVNDTPESTPPPKRSKGESSKQVKTETPKSGGGMKRKNVISSGSDSDEDVKPAAKKTTPNKRGTAAKKPNYAESSDEEEEEKVEVKPKPSASKKGKAKKEESPMDVDDESEESEESDYDDESEEEKPKTKKAKKATPAKSTPKKSPATKPAAKKPPAKSPKDKAKKEPAEEKKDSKPAFNFRAAAAARAAGPRNPGSKDIPEGAPDCLAGLTFVFTGELESLSRDEAQDLAKRYSGKVTGAPSGATSYVVVGDNAGPKKLATIKEKGIETLNEDEFLELIRTRGSGDVDEKTKKAREKQEKMIEAQAKEMEKREKEEEQWRKRKEKALNGTGIAAKKPIPLSAQLWTTKYAPQTVKEMCGNKGLVEKLGVWLQDWQKNYKSNFKKPGKDGMGIFRAILISGPPGIGKTTAAHLMAKQAGYNPLELNASDARSKKLVENSTNIDNASLDGFFQGKGVQSTTVVGDVRVDSRTCLIMDEVDGMSAGDRGGVGALNQLIKKTKIPLILICNDRTLQKMKPLQHTTYNMTFRRPTPNEVRSRIMSILFKEKLKIPINVVDELVKGSNSDIRQVLNIISTFKLGPKTEMDFDEGKKILKINEKNMLLTPFTIIEKLMNPYSFSRTNTDSLNDKMELYFHDFSMVPLFMEEHYLKTNPATIPANSDDKERNLKHLELVSKAADSISDGDLVDRMIRGSEQHWSLLPLHAVTSTVKPAFYTYGPMRSTGGPGSWGPSFPQWLGQNSRQTKLQRLLTDIQIRMRLRVSGSRQEIREQYMPLLATKLVQPLIKEGADAVGEVIENMDEYYLGKEDWDAFVELGVDSMKDDIILKKIPTATKTAFTRQYNKADHPIAFHKGDMFATAKKKIADMGPAPDNEDVLEEDEAPPDDEESNKGDKDDDEEVNDVAKDKLIKALANGGKGKGKAAAKGKKK